MPKLRVLIVDDAVVVRKILTDTLSEDPDIEVFTAANGRIALAKLSQINPDLVTLDVEMPEMDGPTTLRALRKTHPKLPVIMFSTLTEKGAETTLDALSAGANDYVTKPANVGNVSTAITRIREELIPKIKTLCGRLCLMPTMPARPGPSTAVTRPAARPPASRSGPIEIVAVGSSTGGPNALQALLAGFPANFPVPIVIVQHMPPVFTKLLAERLTGQCPLRVIEGTRGTIIKPGHVVIAPGGFHMTIERAGADFRALLNEDPPENSCRPAVDVLFRSVASVVGARSLGVILTGMGSDGLRGCEVLKEAGAPVVVQDEATSVVWGMPGFVARAGLADRVLPLPLIASEVVRRVGEGRVMRSLAG